ncbi:MAG: hypothetical protein IPO67_29190 [Deltaproteobacteria bacterium]|nr:hypothetical protein [Deltaproteobacteria bacterium]
MTYDELLADNTALRALKVTHEAQLAVLQSKVEELAQELARLKRQSFGVSSERLHHDDKQTGLFAEPEPDAPPPEPEAAATPPRKAPPRTVVVAQTASPTSSPGPRPDELLHPLRRRRSARISASIATRLERRRGHFVAIWIRRPSCACGQCNNVETAPEPATFALSRSIAGNGLVARVVVDKFLLCPAAHNKNYAQSTVMRSALRHAAKTVL